MSFDESIELPDNAMLKIRPSLFYEWDFNKNQDIAKDIYKITKGSHLSVWWICRKCGSSYSSVVYNKVKQFKCPYCSGQKVNHTNSLQSTYSELALEWHPIRNKELSPANFTTGSGKKVWWLGSCGHEWQATIKDRVISYNESLHGSVCPICDGKQILVGFNDMWTTNPKMAELLANPNDGYIYTKSSGKSVDWKCSNCGEILYNKSITNVNKKGLSCPRCSDGKSFPEKVMYNLLKQLDLKFEWEKSFEWNPNKRYDFYLEDYNMIIEVHGIQHYKNSIFENAGGRSLSEEIQNDKLKESTALANTIKSYIIINAIKSEFNYLKDQILKSELAELINLNEIDWEEVRINSLKTMMVEVNELYNKGMRIVDIALETKLSNSTIFRYLNGNSKFQKYTNNREVVQLTKSNNYITSFDSLVTAKRETGIGHIYEVCRGIRTSSGGFKWMYRDDYDRYINN